MDVPPLYFKIGGGCVDSPELRNEDRNMGEPSLSPGENRACGMKPAPDNSQLLAKPPPTERKGISKPKRRPWTKEEDQHLIDIIKDPSLNDSVGTPAGSFAGAAQRLGTGRSAKQCRDRWRNFLRDGIKKGKWTNEEEDMITSLYLTWAAMAKVLVGRTDMDIKNKWYAMKRKESRVKALRLQHLAEADSFVEASADPTGPSLETREPSFSPQDWQVSKSKKRKTL